MRKPTYDEIRRLSSELRTETKVRARRDLGTKLHDQLKSESILRRLIAEATPQTSIWPEDDSIIARRCRTMSAMWTSVIQGAIQVGQSIAAGKVKVTEFDIMLPYKLLIACDRSKSLLEDESVSIPMVPRKLVRTLLKYCLDCLADDQLKDLAGVQLLEMLSFLCSKDEFVGFLKHPGDFVCVIDETLSHITPEWEDVQRASFDEATKALDSLLATTRRLGIDMHSFSSETVETIAIWCRSYFDGEQKIIRSQAPAVSNLYNTLVSIVYAHPEYAVGPMKRHGKYLLKFCMKCYPNAKSASKDALNSFLLAYLYLSHFVGNIQGRVTGQVGDLGKGTLSCELIEQFLELVLRDVTSLLERRGASPKGRKRQASLQTMEPRQRIHLELAAKLLACAQFTYVQKQQLLTLEDPTDALLSSLKMRLPETNNEWVKQPTVGPKTCPHDTFSKSPWTKHILSHILKHVDLRKAIQGIEQISSEGLDGGFQQSSLVELRSFLKNMSASQHLPSQPQPMKSILPVVAACAELFPAGQCWTSNVLDGWIELLPSDPSMENVLVCQRCTVGDFSSLMVILASLLEDDGKVGIGSKAQLHLLALLIKLAGSTGLYYRNTSKRRDALSLLAASWRSVWKALLRPDLSYISLTKSAEQGSVGELTLKLLSEICRNRCTDPTLWYSSGATSQHSSFIYKNQSQIWGLNVFERASIVKSIALAELTGWLVDAVGILEGGIDAIDVSHLSSLPSNLAKDVTTRRRKLICFFLATLECTMNAPSTVSQYLVATAISTLSVLIRGSMTAGEGALTTRAYYSSLGVASSLSSSWAQLNEVLREPKRNLHDSCFSMLWNHEDDVDSKATDVQLRHFDITLQCFFRYMKTALFGGKPFDRAVTSDTEVLVHRELATSIVKVRLLAGLSQLTDSSDLDQINNGAPTNGGGMLAVKCFLSIYCTAPQPSESHLLQEMTSHVHTALSSPKSDAGIEETILHVHQTMRCIFEVMTETEIRVDESTLVDISACCKSMLESYRQRLTRTTGNKKKEGPGPSCTLDQDDWMDDDHEAVPNPVHRSSQKSVMEFCDSSDEESTNAGRKRKRGLSSEGNNSHKMSRIASQWLSIPDHSSAARIAELFLYLHPSVSNCEMVCCTLLGADLDLNPVDIAGDVDLRGASSCLRFLTSNEVVLHEAAKALLSEGYTHEGDRESTVSILYKVVDLIRSNASPGSIYYGLGFQECSVIHDQRVSGLEPSWTQADLQHLLDIQMFDDSLDTYSFLRFLKLRSAIESFRLSSGEYHEKFDKAFSGMVRVCLTDMCLLVRQIAIVGVGVALKALDAERVLQAVEKLISPISESTKIADRLKEWKNWYQKTRGVEMQDVEEESDSKLEDLLEIMEAESIYYKAMVAASVIDHSTFLRYLYDIAFIAMRREDLEFVCHKALERVAIARGYTSVDRMIMLESPGLIQLWTGDNLESFPLLLSCPIMLQRLCHYSDERGIKHKGLNTEDLIVTASRCFVAINHYLLVPFSVLEVVRTRPTESMRSFGDSHEILDFLITSSKLRYLCLHSDDDNLLAIVVKLLHKYLPDVFAVCYARLLHSDEPCYRELGTNVLRLMEAVLGSESFRRRLRKKRIEVIQRMLEIWSQPLSSNDSECGNLLQNANAVEEAHKELSSDAKQTGNASTGSESVMNFVRSISKFDSQTISIHLESICASIEVQARLAVQRQKASSTGTNTEVIFFIETLTEILLKPNVSAVIPTLLECISKLLEATLESSFERDGDVKSIIQRLVGACFHLHEIVQRKLLANVQESFNQRRRILTSSFGFLRDLEQSHDVWGWSDATSIVQANFEPTKDKLSKSKEARIATSTFGIIQWILDRVALLPFASSDMLIGIDSQSLSPRETSMLKQIGEEFCAQGLLPQSHDKLLSLRLITEQMNSRITVRHRWSSVLSSEQNDSSTVLNLDQKMILSLIHQLEARLLQRDEDICSDVQESEVLNIIRNLFEICENECPRPLQIAACRCLGLIPSNVILGWESPEFGGTQKRSDLGTSDDLLLSACSECLGVLIERMKSPNSYVSLISMETLASLVSTPLGFEALSLVKDSAARTLLEPFANKRLGRGEFTRLSLHELEQLKFRVGVVGSESDEEDWCWSESLWLCFMNSEVSFNDWISAVTTALIQCLFVQVDNHENEVGSSHDEFFQRCQKICSADHETAALVFPYLVWHILSSCVDGESTRIDAVSKFTRAFTAVMKKCVAVEAVGNHRSAREIIALIIGSLDRLRSISQDRFLSRNQSRNVIKIAGRTPSRATSSEHNHDLPQPTPWCGLPYGVSLCVDGILLAKCCLYVRKYASALFYLEMHINSTFGKVGALFAEFSDFSLLSEGYHRPSEDISGEGKSSEPISSEDARRAMLHTMTIAKECYEMLGETAVAEAIEIQNRAVKFESFGWGTRGATGGYGKSIEQLRLMKGFTSKSSSTEICLPASSLQMLGCHQLTNAYTHRILFDSALLSKLEGEDLESMKEKWFESSLRRQEWDLIERLETETRDGADLLQGLKSIDRKNEGNLVPTGERGFFESLKGAIDAYLLGDAISCRTQLQQSRFSILSSMGRHGSEESTLSAISEFMRTLNSLRDVERILSNDDNNLRDFLARNKLAPENIANYSETVSEHFDEFETTENENRGDESWLPRLALVATYVMRKKNNGSLQQEVFGQLLSSTYISAVAHRRMGEPNVAAECIDKLHHIFDKSSTFEDVKRSDIILTLRLQEARILESRGDFKDAIRTSQQVVNHLVHKDLSASTKQRKRLVADSQVACGTWLTKYKIQQAGTVLDQYLRPGAEHAQQIYEETKSVVNAERTVHASLALARTVSDLHEALVGRIRSSEFKKSSNTRHQEEELQRCEPLLASIQRKRCKSRKGSEFHEELTRRWEELFIYCEHLRKDLNRTRMEREAVLRSEGQYLKLAIESYSTSLSLASSGTAEDISRHVFEFISLWFNNHSDNHSRSNEENINHLMKEAFSRIPSYRFVPLANQLFSRIEQPSDGGENDFQSTLQMLVVQMSKDHPYHCLIPLLALANGKKVGSGVSGRNANAYIENVGNSKVAPATAILSQLQKTSPGYVVGLIESYSLLADSYIHLAGAETSNFHKKTTKDISFSKVASKKVRTLDKCLVSSRSKVEFPPAVFTRPPTLRPGKDYGEGLDDPIGSERIHSFHPTFDITETGIHRPKIVICNGTKGGRFRQLVKGEDEIRQDAIMSQVFGFVNNLLRRQKYSETSTDGKARRLEPNLKMITYNVVPLSPASGVLEWVEDTSPFGDVVLGRGSKKKDFGLHARYYPDDWNFLLCRKHLVDSPHDQKRRTFDEICRRFSPSFRFFFIEQFGHDMMLWHTNRMRYTRSVAVSSMVGHILGIGDRHTSNILVHTKTAEIVQIDFGIVFEQGKLLNVPELVPFRLTQNMIDGMGPCGTDGTFVRASEQTMAVLRDNAKSLLTILSAVVADPLYKWNVSPVEGRRRQKMREDGHDSQEEGEDGGQNGGLGGKHASEEENEMGQKAIAKINDKLNGYEEATSGEQQGVEGQVQLLINSAVDADNLSRMYPGWLAFV